jgi:hypothetical protein
MMKHVLPLHGSSGDEIALPPEGRVKGAQA